VYQSARMMHYAQEAPHQESRKWVHNVPRGFTSQRYSPREALTSPKGDAACLATGLLHAFGAMDHCWHP